MIRIFAIDENGVEEEITDLYWFEEEGVHSFEEGKDAPHGQTYTFRFEVDCEWTPIEGGLPKEETDVNGEKYICLLRHPYKDDVAVLDLEKGQLWGNVGPESRYEDSTEYVTYWKALKRPK